MYKVQFLSDSLTWHTSYAFGNERSAIASAMRLANSGRYRAVRVITTGGHVIFTP